MNKISTVGSSDTVIFSPELHPANKEERKELVQPQLQENWQSNYEVYCQDYLQQHLKRRSQLQPGAFCKSTHTIEENSTQAPS